MLTATNWAVLGLAGIALGATSALVFTAPLLPIAVAGFGNRLLTATSGAAALSMLAVGVPSLNAIVGMSGATPTVPLLIATLASTFMAVVSQPIKDGDQTRTRPEQKPVLSNFMPSAIFTQNGDVSTATPELEKLLGASENALEGRGFLDRVHLLDRVELLNAISFPELDQDGNRVKIRVRSGAETSSVWTKLWLQVQALRDGKGSVVVRFEKADPETQTSEPDASLQQTIDQLRYTNHTITSMFSHKMRNALTAIIGYAELLKYDAASLGEGAEERAETIMSAGRGMASTLDTMVLFSRIASGAYQPNRHNFSLDSVIAEAEENVAALSASRKVTLETLKQAGLPEAQSDFEACEKILSLLLEFATRSARKESSLHLKARQFGRSVKVCIEFQSTSRPSEALDALNGDGTLNPDSTLDAMQAINLSTAKGLVAALGGELSGTCSSGGKAKIELSMPLHLSEARQLRQKDTTSHSPAQTNPRSPHNVHDQGEYCARLSA